MKKAICGFILAICAALFALSACAGTFRFLSVRLKGEDGTITAVAINEFDLSRGSVAVRLTIYRSDVRTTAAEMQAIDSTYTADLATGERLELTADAGEGGWFCAVAEYTAEGATNYIECDPVHYDAQGNRVTETDGVKYEVRKA